MAITTLFLTGFEHGLVSGSGGGLFSVFSAPTVVTSNVRNGAYSLQVAAAGGAPSVASNISGGTKVVCRFGLRNSVRPNANGTVVADIFVGATFLNVTLDTNGTLKLQVGGGTAQTFGVLTLNQWYLIEIQVDSTGTTWTADWKVDRISQTQATLSGQAAGTAIGSVSLGAPSGTPTFTCQYDDWIIGSYTVAATDWYGDGQVLAQVPGSDGTHSFTTNDFSTGDAGTQQASSYTQFFDMVNDAPPWTTSPRSTTDNIAQRVTNTAGYVELAPVAANQSSAANAVRALLAYSSSTTTANTMGCIVRNSAGASVVLFGDLPVAQGGGGGALADYSESTNFFKGAIVTAPAAGWTAAEVNAVRWRLGGSNDISPVPTVQMLMLEVDWPTVRPPSGKRHLPRSVPARSAIFN